MYHSSCLAAITGLILTTLATSAVATSADLDQAKLDHADLHQAVLSNLQSFNQPSIPTDLADTTGANSVGTIQGTVIYPSDILPAQRVCAVNIQTRGAYCTETGEDQNQFSLPVRPGTYHVYAIACRDYLGQTGAQCQGRNYDDQIRAYYDEFVTCGLYAGCGSKLPIAVTVRAGQTVTGVSPHDWYP